MDELEKSGTDFYFRVLVIPFVVFLLSSLGMTSKALVTSAAAQNSETISVQTVGIAEESVVSASDPGADVTTADPVLEAEVIEVVQETSPSATFIFEKAGLQDDIAETKRTLNGQLAEYRQLDQEFTILKGQFVKLNTLSSLEAAVQATRMVQEKRNQVLATYLSLLKLETNSLAGVKPEYAAYLLKEIESLEQALLRHTDQVRLSLDRSAINKASADFVPIAQQVQNTVAFSRSLLQHARYQALFDSTVAVLESIYTPESAPENTNQQQVIVTPQDQRAFEQILEVMIDLEEELNQAELQIQKVIESGESPKGKIDSDSSISKAYGSFTQVFSFLDELLGVY